ncbi:MAG: hypothetical protein QMD14_00375 [Candidatus Aenigmarchaeota archaeon]|nr:hypothetical protein [Candidatus Aenigmarchaeota archaeon]
MNDKVLVEQLEILGKIGYIIDTYIAKGYAAKTEEQLREDLALATEAAYELLTWGVERSEIDSYFKNKSEQFKTYLNFVIKLSEEHVLIDEFYGDPYKFVGKLHFLLGGNREELNNLPEEKRGEAFSSYDKEKEQDTWKLGYEAFRRNSLGMEAEAILKNSMEYKKKQRREAEKMLKILSRIEEPFLDPLASEAYRWLKEVHKFSI